MRFEITLSRDELAQLASELAPIRISLGGRGYVELTEPRELGIVPDRGVAVTASATILLPVPMSRPVRMRDVRVKFLLQAVRGRLEVTCRLKELGLHRGVKVAEKALIKTANAALAKVNPRLDLAERFKSRKSEFSAAIQGPSGLAMAMTNLHLLIDAVAIRATFDVATSVVRKQADAQDDTSTKRKRMRGVLRKGGEAIGKHTLSVPKTAKLKKKSKGEKSKGEKSKGEKSRGPKVPKSEAGAGGPSGKRPARKGTPKKAGSRTSAAASEPSKRGSTTRPKGRKKRPKSLNS